MLRRVAKRQAGGSVRGVGDEKRRTDAPAEPGECREDATMPHGRRGCQDVERSLEENGEAV